MTASASTPGRHPSQQALAPDSRVQFHELVSRWEDGEFILGRIDTGDFIALPPLGQQAYELLRQGCSIGEAEQAILDRQGVELDVQEFVSSLIELDFIRSLDLHEFEPRKASSHNLPWIQPQHVSWLLSWPTAALFGSMSLAALVTLYQRPDLIPRYEHFFWVESTSVLVLGNFVILVIGTSLHELAHLLTARAAGVPARIGLSTRLHYLVVQTDVSALWSVERRKRYPVYLAGMAMDVTLLSGALLLRAHAPLSPGVDALLAAIVLVSLLGLLWQLNLYMRTDLYFVLLDLLRCRNLFQDSLDYLKYGFRRLLRHIRGDPSDPAHGNPLESLPRDERGKIRLYSLLLIVGTSASLTSLGLYGLPIMLDLLGRAWHLASAGYTSGDQIMFLDGSLTLVVELFLQGVFVWALWRNHRPALASWLRGLRPPVSVP